MCDTLVALQNSAKEGVTIFAKNSDREPNEPQALEFYLGMEVMKNSSTALTLGFRR